MPNRDSSSGKRIVLVPSSFAPKVGGVETAVMHLACEFARRGHKVTVITNRYPRSLPAFELIQNIPVYRILMPGLIPPKTRIYRNLKSYLGIALAPIQFARLARLALELAPDVMNVHYLGVPAVYGAMTHRLRLSSLLVLSVHGSDVTTIPYPSGSPRLHSFIFREAQGVTAVSHYLAEKCKAWVGSQETPIMITGNGVTGEEYARAAAHVHSSPFIFAASHLTRQKGMDVLLKALVELSDRGIMPDLIIAGNGPEKERLQALVHTFGLERRVHFWGQADRNEMASLYAGCVFFVHPSLNEGFGLVALEAMICGKAVITTHVGGLPEVVEDGITGLLIPPKDSTALANAIETLWHNPSHAKAMGQAGRELAYSQFTWSRVAERYLEAYELASRG